MLDQLDFKFFSPKYQNSIHHYCLSKTQRFGLTIEKYIQSELAERGHTADLLTDFSARYDILCDGSLPIEVKAATCTRRKNGRGRYQFCLSGGLNYLKCDFIYCLVAVDANGEIYTFVVPSAFVGGRQFVELSSHPNVYSGRWKQYLDAWHWVDVVKAWRVRLSQTNRQMSLFDVEVSR